jgi:hypothetical protein
MQRALRFDGLLPVAMHPRTHKIQEMTPPLLRQIADYCIERQSGNHVYDVIWEGMTPGTDAAQAAEIVNLWKEAGATWWNEAMWGVDDQAVVLERIQQGPPSVS